MKHPVRFPVRELVKDPSQFPSYRFPYIFPQRKPWRILHGFLYDTFGLWVPAREPVNESVQVLERQHFYVDSWKGKWEGSLTCPCKGSCTSSWRCEYYGSLTGSYTRTRMGSGTLFHRKSRACQLGFLLVTEFKNTFSSLIQIKTWKCPESFCIRLMYS